MYGRVLKVLGNLNFQVYGNDGRTRICKVCGAMRKRIWITTGDLVILSLREFEVSNMVKKKEERVKMTERGDIIYKFDQTLIGKAKKLDGINPNLFLQLETADGKQIAGMSDKAMEETIDDMFGFDEDAEDGEKKESESEESDDEKPNAPSKKGKAKESKHAAGGDDDAFDIDDI